MNYKFLYSHMKKYHVHPNMVLPFYGEIYFENDIFGGVFTPIFPQNSLKKIMP